MGDSVVCADAARTFPTRHGHSSQTAAGPSEDVCNREAAPRRQDAPPSEDAVSGEAVAREKSRIRLELRVGAYTGNAPEAL